APPPARRPGPAARRTTGHDEADPAGARRKSSEGPGHAQLAVAHFPDLGGEGDARGDGKVTPVHPLGDRRVRRLIACAAALAALLVSAVATRAQDLTGSVVLDMKGTVAADKAAASEAGWQAITFGFTGLEDNTVRWFGVVHASLFDGDTFDARTIINAASHYDPTVTIVGPPELAKKLHDLPNGTRVSLGGVLVPSTRNMMLGVVKALPPPAAK